MAATIEGLYDDRRVIVSSLATGEQLAALGGGNASNICWFPQQNALLLSTFGNDVLMFDTATWQMRATLAATGPMDVSQDGRTLVTYAEGRPVLWNTATRRRMFDIPVIDPPIPVCRLRRCVSLLMTDRSPPSIVFPRQIGAHR